MDVEIKNRSKIKPLGISIAAARVIQPNDVQYGWKYIST